MKFSEYLRIKILEKHGTFRKAAEILGKKEEEFTRKLSNKSEKSSPRKIWLTEIDEWEEKLNLSLLEDIDLRGRITRLEQEIYRIRPGKIKKGANPGVKSRQTGKTPTKSR